MLKVLKNLKNSFWSVVLIILLLIVQAQADLRLPDYTSKIVNEGIQSGGIETAVPEVISKEDMENILMFSEEDDKITENYTLIGENPSKEQEKVLENYLGKDYSIEPDTIYVLNDIRIMPHTYFYSCLNTKRIIYATCLVKIYIILHSLSTKHRKNE